MVRMRLKKQHTGVGIGAGAAKTVHADRKVAAANVYFMLGDDEDDQPQ
jgi:hypothetical protein